MGGKDTFLGKLLGNTDTFSPEQVAQTINMLIEHGIAHEATDIHIEPHKRFVLVRYRIHNTLRGVHKLPLTTLEALITEVKKLAHLKTSEPFMPQEGAYATLVGEQQFEIRVNTLPVLGGEKAVLHISRRLNKPPTLEELGYWGPSLRALRTAVTHPHGLVTIAAPRRNGKSTTMHSMLRLMNTPLVSIATVEDTIEYRLPGANQTHVRPQQGITFAEGLQAALNQDPNIVMVSSLPDHQTTELAVQAAVGGHFILAGLYADSAPASLTHLRAMSQDTFLLGSALRTAISQRLVRRLCTHCRKSYTPTIEELALLNKSFGIGTPAARNHLHELEKRAQTAGLGADIHLGSTSTTLAALWTDDENGCEACSYSGYQGAIAIAEVLTVSEEIQKLLLGNSLPSAISIAARAEGFIPMNLDGLVKVLRGQTSIQELLRVLSA